MQKTQRQMFYDSAEKVAAMDRAIMDMIHCKENPMTAKDLQALVERWPERYGRYAGLIPNI